jgi:uncharacterized protein
LKSKINCSLPILIALGTSLCFGCAALGQPSETSEMNESAPTVVSADQRQWFDMANQVVVDLRVGSYGDVEQMSTAEVRQALPANKLKATWEAVLDEIGPYVATDGLQYAENASYHTVIADCRFEKMSLDITLTFDSNRKLSGIYLKPHASQTPAESVPEGLTERQVTVGANGSWPLPGTLTLPAGPGPFPAIVLVHGSGPEDRDETIASNKPFRDLAWGLAQRGVAVLRYEKRTQEYPLRCVASAKFDINDETIDDAVFAAMLLRTTSDVDTKRIFVLGHSLGAMVIPRIARRTPFAVGYIIMAGATETLEDAILRQVKERLAGTNTPEAKATVAQIEAQVAEVKSANLSTTTPAAKLPLGGGVTGAYWLSIRNLHAAEEARQIIQPLLILQGGEDQQVEPSNLSVWKSELAAKNNVTYRLYPGLSHLFIAGQPNVEDYYSHPGHVSDAVIEDIANWVKHTGGARDVAGAPQTGGP